MKKIIFLIAISLITLVVNGQNEKRKMFGQGMYHKYFLWFEVGDTELTRTIRATEIAKSNKNTVTEKLLPILIKHEEYQRQLVESNPDPELISEWIEFREIYNELTSQGISFYIIHLKGIEFNTASSTLNSNEKKLVYNSAIKDLENYILNLKKNNKYGIYVDIVCEGYTDDRGGDDYNRKLSDRRANAVLDYIIDENLIKLEEDGIFKIQSKEAIGFGEDKPPPGVPDKSGNVKERRVVVVYRYINWDR